MPFDDLLVRARQVCVPRRLREDGSCGSVGAALEGADGEVYVGVCVDVPCSLGFCAETAAAAAMLTAGTAIVRRIVAVTEDGHALPPCGRCREFLAQLAVENLDALVLVGDGQQVTLGELLPHRWLPAVR